MAHAIPTSDDLDAMVAEIAAGGDPDRVCAREDIFFPDHTPLTLAIYLGRMDAVRWLIDRGASVNAFADNWFTPIGAAMYTEDRAVARLLLDNGADPNEQRDFHGYSPIHTAAGYHLVGIAALLLERGADIEARDSTGSTALMLAAINGRKAMTQFLLEHGADVNARNKEGWTALMGAVSKGNREMARLLLNHGADLDLGPARWPGPPLNFARSMEDEKMADLLIEYGAEGGAKTS